MGGYGLLLLTRQRNNSFHKMRDFSGLLERLLDSLYEVKGARGGVVFEALRYKPEGRGFNSRCCQ
jgi:hypothetical protein